MLLRASVDEVDCLVCWTLWILIMISLSRGEMVWVYGFDTHSAFLRLSGGVKNPIAS